MWELEIGGGSEVSEALLYLERLEKIVLKSVPHAQDVLLPTGLRELEVADCIPPKMFARCASLQKVKFSRVPNVQTLTFPGGLRELSLERGEAPAHLAYLKNLEKVILKRVPNARDVLLPPSVRDLQIIDWPFPRAWGFC